MGQFTRISAGAFVVLAAAAVLAGPGHDGYPGQSERALPKCPVMGEPINFAISTETDDGPVFFCCKSCVNKFRNNPDKYAKATSDQRAALSDRPKIQVTCPVSRKPVDTDVSITHNGQKIYFCSVACAGKYKADPGRYASALANSYTYQMRCPVMGGQIAPAAFLTTQGGANLYFCCKGCDKQLVANPTKYLPNLKTQGLVISAEDVAGAADNGHEHEHRHGHDYDAHGH